MSKTIYSLGLDFGTNSIRTLILNLLTGEIGSPEGEKMPIGRKREDKSRSDHFDFMKDHTFKLISSKIHKGIGSFYE